eukprot:jgi/Chlat1/7736/Chrsp66S07211
MGLLVSRLWRGGGGRGYLPQAATYEKSLEKLTNDAKALQGRLNARARLRRRFAQSLALYGFLVEMALLVIALVYGRQPRLEIKQRLLFASPSVAFPVLLLMFWKLTRFVLEARDRGDKARLHKVEEKKKSLIEELKERTAYNATLNLLQKYDKSAAEEMRQEAAAGNDGKTEQQQQQQQQQQRQQRQRQTGIRRRPQRSSSMPAGTPRAADHGEQGMGAELAASTGLLARMAAMLVGEDPTQCFALICCNCHMHNGLARREDLETMYICRYCNYCNGTRSDLQEEHASSPMASGIARASPGASPTAREAAEQQAEEAVTASAAATAEPAQDSPAGSEPEESMTSHRTSSEVKR